jgi:YD repeat-containing protein
VNQLLSKTLPGSQVTSYLYDLAGNVTTVTDPDSVLTMTYDLANRLINGHDGWFPKSTRRDLSLQL